MFFYFKESLKKHYIISHGDNCPEGIKYQEARKYENGVRNKLWNNKRAYTTIKEMKAILYNNENNSSEVIQKSENSPSFSCKMCEYVGASEELLSMHVKVVHIHTSVTNFKFICNICGHQTKFKWSMTKHKRLVHKIIEESPLKCDQCSKSFAVPENMKKHIKYNLCGDNPLPIPKLICDDCGKSFTSSGHLKVHVKNIHEGHKDYKCESCGKSFFEGRKLKLHIRTVHEGHKDFKCESCEKSFTEAHNLRKHIRTIHEGSRDHKCDSCDKSFFIASKLKEHIYTVHEGHRPHICEACGKSYATSGNLTTHFKRSHEIKEIKDELRTYQCETCGKNLICEAGLKKHIKVYKNPNFHSFCKK